MKTTMLNEKLALTLIADSEPERKNGAEYYSVDGMTIKHEDGKYEVVSDEGVY